MSPRGGLLAVVVAASVVRGGVAAAAAPDTDACLASYEQTQRARGAGKLVAAEREAIVCASDACPAALRSDCITWLDEIRRAIPRVTVHATAPNGCDLTQAQVVVDGTPVADTLDGRPLRLDPGPHTVRVQTANGAAREQKVVLVEAERDRLVELTFAEPGAACGRTPAPSPAPAPPAPAAAAPAASRSRGASKVTWLVAAIGATALGVGATVEAFAWSEESDLSRCRPRCNPNDVAAMRRSFIAGDALVATGVIALAVAGYLWLTSRSSARKAEAPPLIVRF